MFPISLLLLMFVIKDLVVQRGNMQNRHLWFTNRTLLCSATLRHLRSDIPLKYHQPEFAKKKRKKKKKRKTVAQKASGFSVRFNNPLHPRKIKLGSNMAVITNPGFGKRRRKPYCMLLVLVFRTANKHFTTAADVETDISS